MPKYTNTVGCLLIDRPAKLISFWISYCLLYVYNIHTNTKDISKYIPPTLYQPYASVQHYLEMDTYYTIGKSTYIARILRNLRILQEGIEALVTSILIGASRLIIAARILHIMNTMQCNAMQ